MCSEFHRYCNTPMSQCVVHFMCSGTLKCLSSSTPVSKFTVMFYSRTAMCSAFHRYCNTPMSQCVVHFMCSGTLKCLIQHSS